MHGWTKQDYANNYKTGVERKMRPGCPNTRKPVAVAYIRKFIEPYIHGRLDALIDRLRITSRDRVVIVGCGFGWGTEYIMKQTGCDAVGTDISDWIQAEKNNDESNDIRKEIAKVDLDPAGERAQQILEFCLTPGSRARSRILNEDLMSASSRHELESYFRNLSPTWIITEDMIQPLTDINIRDWVEEIDKFGANVCHLHNAAPRTNAELHELTGHRCFQYGVNELLGAVS